MEPLSPNDPLHTLLGKARPVEPRPNFTQNVVRAIRQVPQSVSLWERIQAWVGGLSMPRVALAGAAALVAVTLAVMTLQKPATDSRLAAQTRQESVAQQPSVQPALHEVSTAMILAATAEVAPVTATEPDDMDPMGLLMVHQDTSALSDSELALLVY